MHDPLNVWVENEGWEVVCHLVNGKESTLDQMTEIHIHIYMTHSYIHMQYAFETEKYGGHSHKHALLS